MFIAIRKRSPFFILRETDKLSNEFGLSNCEKVDFAASAQMPCIAFQSSARTRLIESRFVFII